MRAVNAKAAAASDAGRAGSDRLAASAAVSGLDLRVRVRLQDDSLFSDPLPVELEGKDTVTSSLLLDRTSGRSRPE